MKTCKKKNTKNKQKWCTVSFFCGIVFLYCLTLLFPPPHQHFLVTPFYLCHTELESQRFSAAVRSGSPSPVYAVPVGLYNEWAPNSHPFGNNQFTYKPTTSSSSTAKPPPSSENLSLISSVTSSRFVFFLFMFHPRLLRFFSLLYSFTLLKYWH